MSKISHLIRRVTPEKPGTRFESIESGRFFKDLSGDGEFYQKVSRSTGAWTLMNAVRVRDGSLYCFADDAKIEPFGDDEELVIEMWRSE